MRVTRRELAAQMALVAAACAQTSEPYVHATVREPFPDGIRLEIPEEVAGQSKARWGLVDVTEAPFRADPTGKADSTAALQRAIDFARDHQMVCWFPAGVYRISDTLRCIVNRYQRSNRRVLGAGQLFPCVLVGSRAAATRPRILLAPRAPGFGDANKPKIAIYVWARGYQVADGSGPGDAQGPEVEQPNISFNQMLVNLDIEIGEGNPGAIALRHQGAEGSAIENCRIDVTHGHTGIQGGIGSGGGSTNVTVVGGRVGLDFTGYFTGTQPTPTITGFTLIGQRENAIRSTSRQTLVAAGLKIVAAKGAGPLIDCSMAKTAGLGQLSWLDGEAVFPDGDDAGRRVAIASASSVYLKNVFLRGARNVVENPENQTAQRGVADGWLHVREAAVPGVQRQNQSLAYDYPVYINGERRQAVLWDVAPGVQPPRDLQSRHSWGESFPHWEEKGAVNAKLAPFHAKGDGVTDDTAALQRAIDAHDVVFLPKGYYRVSRTLRLRPASKLIGVAQHLSVIVAVRAEGDFANHAHPAPLVRTADEAQASTVLAFLGLFPGGDAASFALEWRCGGASVFRAVELHEFSVHGFTPRKRTDPVPPIKQHPLVVITGHGGGRWYNFRAGSAWGHGNDYRHMLVRNNTGPLAFYQFSPQHAVSQCATEFDRASGVSIYGAKYEGNVPMVWVHDCADFRLFGHGGNGKGVENGTLLLVERTGRVLIANAVDGPTRIGSGGGGVGGSGASTDPRKWTILIDRPAKDTELKPRPLDRPVLWKRGY